MQYFGKIAGGLRSLLVGLSITFKWLWRTVVGRQAVTLRYPHVEPELSPNYRSAIKLIRFDETNSHDCVACLQCEKICPSACITIEGEKVDGIKKQRAIKFDMDFALCSLCGLCVDACPTETLTYSKVYDHVGRHRNGFVYDLVAPYTAGEEAYLAAKRAEAEAAAEAARRKKAKEEESA